MKKQTLIIIILCVLVAAVIALNVTGIIGPPQGSFAGISGIPTVTPANTDPSYSYDDWDNSIPTTP